MQSYERKPAVAGSFYPADQEELFQLVESYTPILSQPQSVIGAMAPHAGYIYSGAVAGAVYGQIQVPDTIVVICPKHRAIGAHVAIMSQGNWSMPGFAMQINNALASAIKEKITEIEEDERAHLYEHSLEVHLPFLYHKNPHATFVPIACGFLPEHTCLDIGRKLAEFIHSNETLVVASSDMSHHIPASMAKELDFLAIEQMERLDPSGLYNVVAQNNISMCGVIPSTILLSYAKEKGATNGKLIKYSTSGDVTGDNSAVVGYAGMTFH